MLSVTEMVATALEKAHVAVVRFSTMGNLQAILETEAMVSQFCAVCTELEESLRSLGDVSTGVRPELQMSLGALLCVGVASVDRKDFLFGSHRDTLANCSA